MLERQQLLIYNTFVTLYNSVPSKKLIKCLSTKLYMCWKCYNLPTDNFMTSPGISVVNKYLTTKKIKRRHKKTVRD